MFAVIGIELFLHNVLQNKTQKNELYGIYCHKKTPLYDVVYLVKKE